MCCYGNRLIAQVRQSHYYLTMPKVSLPFIERKLQVLPFIERKLQVLPWEQILSQSSEWVAVWMSGTV